MSSSDTSLVSTYTNSETFATIYFYSYALVVLAILFGAAYFATKEKLYHQSYFTLDKIEVFLAYITIGINSLEKKYKLEDKLVAATKNNDKDEMSKIESKLEKLSRVVDSNHVKLYVSFMFEKIRKIIDRHEAYLLKKIDSIDEKYERDKMQSIEATKENDNDNTEAGAMAAKETDNETKTETESPDAFTSVKVDSEKIGTTAEALSVHVNMSQEHVQHNGSENVYSMQDSHDNHFAAPTTSDNKTEESGNNYISSDSGIVNEMKEINDSTVQAKNSDNTANVASNSSTPREANEIETIDSENILPTAATNNKDEKSKDDKDAEFDAMMKREYDKMMDQVTIEQIEDELGISMKKSNTRAATNKSPKDAKIQAIEEFVQKQYQKHQLSNTQGFLTFFKILYKIRGLLIPALTHFFDTATDISLVWEWYLLYRLQENGEFTDYNIKMLWFFVCSLIVLIYYRISSAFEVWQFTRNKYESVLQFLFDFFLIKLIYINIFKMKSYEPSQIIKQFRMIEGGNESAFQAILTLVFLIKTQFNEATTIAVISLVASLFSLVSRLSVLDKNGLIEKARELADFELLDVLNPCKLIGKIKYEWVIHRIYRSMDILFSIFLISLFWDVVGGQWLLILLVVGLIDIYIQYLNSGQIKTDWFNYILVINITQLKDMYEIYCDAWISVDRECGTRLIRLRLFWIRSVMIVWCILVMYSDNVVYSNEIKHIFSLLLINVHLLIILMSIYVVKALTIDDLYEKSSIENLRVFDYIGSNNEECIWFCKYLKCNIFYEATTRNIHECQCFKKEKPNVIEFSEPSNVKEALIKSGNWDNYMILEEWYYASESERGLDFGDFLKDASFSRLTFGGKIKAFRDNLPAYILLQRLGLTLVGYENVSFFLYDACKQQSLAVAQYVVLAAGSEMKYRESSRLWNNLDIAMDRKLNDNQANIAVLLWANGFNTMDMPNDQSGQIKNMLKRHFLAA